MLRVAVSDQQEGERERQKYSLKCLESNRTPASSPESRSEFKSNPLLIKQLPQGFSIDYSVKPILQLYLLEGTFFNFKTKIFDDPPIRCRLLSGCC
jgi:hypothetical protein